MPILQHIAASYQLWQSCVRNFPKDTRYTLGGKIDQLFLVIIEALLEASHSTTAQKLPYLKTASLKLDLLKFFLQLAWNNKALDNKKYIVLSEHLEPLGRQIGGWQKMVQKQTPPEAGKKCSC